MGYSVGVPPVGRANFFSSANGLLLSYSPQRLNNCNNTLCYTYNHNYIYKPHTAYGRVGTSAAGYLASRKRL
jgi:hypothetical protein